ncbi:MAG: hypothetical protein QXS93_01615 [Candidatus Micrarchaeia archaeon]
MQRGQIVFDFLIALSALAVVFTALLAVAHTQGQQSVVYASRLVMERTCEEISQKILSAKISGNGAVRTFYSQLPVAFNGTSREVYIAESYVCVVPEQYTSQVSENVAGEFRIENRDGAIIITRLP